jgi:threonine dehydrogenase-like Zn-dependent dehydrogenase
MKALQYRKSVPRYALLKLLGSRMKSLCTGAASLVSLVDTPEPRLPNEQWVRIAPKLTGICGSDLATICAKGSPYLSPVTSMPFVMGHEVVGTVTHVGSAVTRVRVGDRVVLQPALGCTVRGIDPKCAACSKGNAALCCNITRGAISPGIQSGFCRDTGGGFSESLIAHDSQIYKVPPEIPDEAAVLIEPFSCALHAALRVSPEKGQTALVIGCGSIGLLTIAALRAIGCPARIVAVARYDHQRRLAQELGAEEMLDSPRTLFDRYRLWAKALSAEVHEAQIGKPLVIGGADAVFDCVASSESIDDGVRFARSGGTFALVGMPGIPRGVDWTPIWFKELTVQAAYAYGREDARGGKDTFEIAIEMMKDRAPQLAKLVGRPFPLRQYKAAIQQALSTGRSKVVKTVIAPQDGRSG